MEYGDHTDIAVNWAGQQFIRSDLSFTIFLLSPDEYEGGELIANVFGGEPAVKYDRGDMVIYPSVLTHRVGAVTSGCRRAGYKAQFPSRSDAKLFMQFFRAVIKF